MAEPTLPPRYAFVGGLHRSGTSLLARLIASHPEVTALHAPDVPEGEGVYLQGAIPHTARHGIPGAFAFDPAQHLTETHALNRLETRARIDRDWGPRFDANDANAVWRVEKSPVNILRTRLYQQLFPLSHHIIITRHPVAVAQATAKWADSSLPRLVEHWAQAHAILLKDLPYLHAVLIVRYEDLIASPGASMARVFRFLDLPYQGLDAITSIHDGNTSYTPVPTVAIPEPAAQLGYGATFDPARPLPGDIACRHPLKHIQTRCRSTLDYDQNGVFRRSAASGG